MKKQFTSKALVVLQMAVLAGIVSIAAFGLLSFKGVTRYADVWQVLGTDQKSGTYNIRESFLGGYIQYGGATNLRKIVAGDRAAVAKDLLAYTKEYVGSEAFVKAYSADRERAKPTAPEPLKTEAQIRQEGIESNKKGLENLEKLMKTANESMKKDLQSAMDMLNKSIKDYEDPNSEMVKMTLMGNKTQYDWRMNEYQEQVKKWETKYPADVKVFVKGRLQQLLAATKDVDFNAQLTERNGRKYFVNATYEHKSANWKLAFRAGKEVTTTVRAFVQQWITEL